jgi:hypothetical protein
MCLRDIDPTSLRIKDVDFDRHVIIVRDAKCGTANPLDVLQALVV